ncbi:MAG: hypothetical protein HQL24_01030 [Candidatus Omnitrophica bacterium]|nr:hypothetical protein [Candidatus Omnitrophota bacterium]
MFRGQGTTRSNILKTISLIVLFIFIPQTLFAQISLSNLPTPGTMVATSASFVPPVLKGMKVDLKQPFQFDFILDTGNSNLKDDELKEESNKLIRYFLSSLTIPEKDLWVNLSPYEKNRIIPDEFGTTEMGRDLLAQDYILKQITASLMYPENETGKAFWQKVYKKAYDLYGTTDIPTDTFNKVWIVPDKAVVYENPSPKPGEATVFVVEARLKVMLEEDYFATSNTVGAGFPRPEDKGRGNRAPTAIIKEVIIPILEKEVNEGQNFAQLRQVYYSLILAKWYKDSLKESILNRKYSGQKKVMGVDLAGKEDKQKIYEQYLAAFKKGAFNYIKEEYDANSKTLIPRKYFSGGANMGKVPLAKTGDLAMTSRNQTGKLLEVAGRLIDPQKIVEKETRDVRALMTEEEKQYFQKVFPALNLEKALEVPPIETVRNAEELKRKRTDARAKNWENYLKNQKDLRTDILLLLADIKNGTIFTQRDFIDRLAGLNKILLTGKDGKTFYLAPTLSSFMSVKKLHADESNRQNQTLSELAGEYRSTSTKYGALLVKLFREIKNFTELKKDSNTLDVLKQIASIYEIAMEQFLFVSGNNSLFMNMANGLLRLYGFDGIAHYQLDMKLTARIFGKSIKRDFIKLVLKANPQMSLPAHWKSQVSSRKQTMKEIIEENQRFDRAMTVKNDARQDSTKLYKRISSRIPIVLRRGAVAVGLLGLALLPLSDNFQMRDLPPANLAKIALQGNKEALDILKNLADDQGNASAQKAIETLPIKTLADLTAQGNITAFRILLNRMRMNNLVAQNALKTLRVDLLVQRLNKGDRDAFFLLLDLGQDANNLNAQEAFNNIQPQKLAELISRDGNVGATDILENLALWKDDTGIVEILRTVKVQKLAEQAYQGKRDAFDVIAYLYQKYNNVSAKNVLSLFPVQRIVKSVVQGNMDAYLMLESLSAFKNLGTREILRNLNVQQLTERAYQGNKDAINILIMLDKDNQNPAAQKALKDMAVQLISKDKKIFSSQIRSLIPYCDLNTLMDLLLIDKSSIKDPESFRPALYYQIADRILSELQANPNLVGKEAQWAKFRSNYKKAIAGMEGIEQYSPQVMDIVYKSIDLMGTEKLAAVSKEVENEFHVPPMRMLFYNSMPRAVTWLVDAYQEVTQASPNNKLDFNFFYATALVEGWPLVGRTVMEGAQYLDVTTTQPMGLDRFPSVMDKLIKEKKLPGGENFRKRINLYNHRYHGRYQYGQFRDVTSALDALGAMILEDEEYFRQELTARGINPSGVNVDAFRVGTYLHFCTPGDLFKQYFEKYAHNQETGRYDPQGLIGKRGKGKGKPEGQGEFGNGIYNAQYLGATAKLLDLLFPQMNVLLKTSTVKPSAKQENRQTSRLPSSVQNPNKVFYEAIHKRKADLNVALRKVFAASGDVLIGRFTGGRIFNEQEKARAEAANKAVNIIMAEQAHLTSLLNRALDHFVGRNTEAIQKQKEELFFNNVARLVSQQNGSADAAMTVRFIRPILPIVFSGLIALLSNCSPVYLNENPINPIPTSVGEQSPQERINSLVQVVLNTSNTVDERVKAFDSLKSLRAVDALIQLSMSEKATVSAPATYRLADLNDSTAFDKVLKIFINGKSQERDKTIFVLSVLSDNLERGHPYKYLFTCLRDRSDELENKTLSAQDMYLVYSNHEFQRLTNGMEENDQFSVARGIENILVRFHKNINDQNITLAAPDMVEAWQTEGHNLALDGNTQVIASFHKEFDSEKVSFVELMRPFGIILKENSPQFRLFSGSNNPFTLYKTRKGLWQAIENSKGQTLLFFEHHGDGLHLASSSYPTFGMGMLSYDKLARSLSQRARKTGGDLSKVTIVINACYSSDYSLETLNALYDDIAKLSRVLMNDKEITGFPTIVTSTNRGMSGFSTLMSMQKVFAGKQEIHVSDFYDIAREMAGRHQSMGFFLNIPREKLEQLRKKLGAPDKNVNYKSGEQLNPNLPMLNAQLSPKTFNDIARQVSQTGNPTFAVVMPGRSDAAMMTGGQAKKFQEFLDELFQREKDPDKELLKAVVSGAKPAELVGYPNLNAYALNLYKEMHNAFGLDFVISQERNNILIYNVDALKNRLVAAQYLLNDIKGGETISEEMLETDLHDFLQSTLDTFKSDPSAYHKVIGIAVGYPLSKVWGFDPNRSITSVGLPMASQYAAGVSDKYGKEFLKWLKGGALDFPINGKEDIVYFEDQAGHVFDLAVMPQHSRVVVEKVMDEPIEFDFGNTKESTMAIKFRMKFINNETGDTVEEKTVYSREDKTVVTLDDQGKELSRRTTSNDNHKVRVENITPRVVNRAEEYLDSVYEIFKQIRKFDSLAGDKAMMSKPTVKTMKGTYGGEWKLTNTNTTELLPLEQRQKIKKVVWTFSGRRLSRPLLANAMLIPQIEQLFPNAQINIYCNPEQYLLKAMAYGKRVRIINKLERQHITRDTLVINSDFTFHEGRYPHSAGVLSMVTTNDIIFKKGSAIAEYNFEKAYYDLKDSKQGLYYRRAADALRALGLKEIKGDEPVVFGPDQFSDELKSKIAAIRQTYFVGKPKESPVIFFNAAWGSGLSRGERDIKDWQQLIGNVLQNTDAYIVINKGDPTWVSSQQGKMPMRFQIDDLYQNLRKWYPKQAHRLVEIPSEGLGKDLIRLMAVMSLSDAVITENSGVTHLADFMNKPCASFLNPWFLKYMTKRVDILDDDLQKADLQIKDFLKKQNINYQPESDAAMSTTAPGGIDFNPDRLKLEKKGVHSDFDLPTDAGDLDKIQINGLVPVILHITPVTNLPVLLGANQNNETIKPL